MLFLKIRVEKGLMWCIFRLKQRLKRSGAFDPGGNHHHGQFAQRVLTKAAHSGPVWAHHPPLESPHPLPRTPDIDSSAYVSYPSGDDSICPKRKKSVLPNAGDWEMSTRLEVLRFHVVCLWLSTVVEEDKVALLVVTGSGGMGMQLAFKHLFRVFLYREEKKVKQFV